MVTSIRLTTLLALAVCTVLTGCTLQTTATPNPVVAASTSIAGAVHGGAQPISSARLYLLTPGVSGNAGPGSGGLIPASSANASISLLGSASATGSDSIGNYMLTGADGSFSITGDYSCTTGTVVGSGTAATLSGSEPIYLYVVGGNPGNGSPNTSISLLAALGPCNSPNATVTVNEATTVAMAYSVAGYATDPTHIASDSAVNATYGALANIGITNAFLVVNSLINTTTGVPLAKTPTGGDGISPIVGTLANALASCVDGTTGNANCSTLFSNAETAGTSGTAPTDTATAAINLAHNQTPGTAAVTALYGLQAGVAAPFAGLNTQPSNFILAIDYGLDYGYIPSQVVIDGDGDAWIIQGPYLQEVTPTGSHSSFSINSPGGLAIDQGGNLWLTSNSNNSVVEMSPSGTTLATYTGHGLVTPGPLAIDGASNAWVISGSSTSNAVTVEISNNGSYLSGSAGYPAPSGFSPATSIALDGAGSAWLGYYGSNAIQKLSSSGAALSGTSGFSDPNGPNGLALDHSGNLWVGNVTGGTLSEFSNTGGLLSPAAGYPTAVSGILDALAFDGSGTLHYFGETGYSWYLEQTSATGAAIPANTVNFGDSRTNYLAVDPSGNLWYSLPYSGLYVEEDIGYTTPAITPLAAALPVTPTADGSSSLGTRP